MAGDTCRKRRAISDGDEETRRSGDDPGKGPHHERLWDQLRDGDAGSARPGRHGLGHRPHQRPDSGTETLSDYRLLVFPGGFSYGDDTGAGNAYANRVRNNLWEDLEKFLDGDNLVLGICNGFQILANLGLVPAFDKQYTREIALMPNRGGRLECRFVTLKPAADNLWTQGIERIYCPVAHGEGNFYCSEETLQRLKGQKMIAFTYCREDLSPADGEYPYNPNGSLEDIAGITSADGKVLRPDAAPGAGDGVCEPL